MNSALRYSVAFVCFCLFLSTSFVKAQEQEVVQTYYGLAMHGEPALSRDFSHFPYANPDAPKSGDIRHMVVGSYDNLNPHIVKGTAAEGMNNMYGRLMARSWDEPFTLYPWIATHVKMPDDRMWIEIYLNKDAEFNDHSPITADDVLFSYETLKEKGRPNFRNVYGLVETATKINNHTVRFDFNENANRETAMIMAMMPVYSKTYWADKNFDETTLTPFVSSGPYRIKDVQPGRQIIYERVEDYWAKDLPALKGQYNFDHIIYDYYRDSNVAFQAFKSGNVDFMRETDAARWQSEYDFPAIQKGDVNKIALKHKRPEWVHGFIFNTRRTPFEDRDLRKALGHAFDFEWMNKTLFQDAFTRTTSIYPNSELAAPALPSEAEKKLLEPYRNDIPQELWDTEFTVPQTSGVGRSGIRDNLKRAADILNAGGYGVENGVRTGKDGKALSFEILLQDPKQEKVALEYARNLKRLGIEAIVRNVDSAQFFARLNDYDYDIVLYKWHSTLSPGNEQLFYWGSSFADIPGSRNYPGIKSPAVDFLANEIAQAKTREELVTAAHALDRVIMWGYYFVPLYYDGTDKMAYWHDLQHSDYTPLYGAVLESWWKNPQKTQ